MERSVGSNGEEDGKKTLEENSSSTASLLESEMMMAVK
jgi:hypothetical protein